MTTPPHTSARPRGPALLIAFWAVGGVLLLLTNAVVRLTPMALEPIGAMTPFQWSLWIGNVLLMAWSEGYRGFQKGFSPRVAVRAMHLASHPRWHHVLLAPPYAMGLIHATRRRLITSWSITLMIVGLVLAVRHLDQPWRGIVDAGVVAGLAWGMAALMVEFGKLLAGRPAPVSAETPDPSTPADDDALARAA